MSRSAQVHAWTRGIARGDRSAFASFYDAWFDRALALASKTMAGDADAAFDVVQDVMMRVAERMPVLRDEAAVGAWMKKVVCSVAIDRLRADNRRSRHERAAGQRDLDPDSAEAAAAESVVRTERVRAVRDRLVELPAAERAALLARYADERTFEEIGSTLGITGNAAHGRIRRTLDRLRRTWGNL